MVSRKKGKKSMRRFICLTLAAAAGLLFAGLAQGRADDSFPPCWRSGPGTTYENWSFMASNNPANPDTFTNPNGTPQANFTLGPFGKGWLASTALGTRSGVWSLGLGGQVSVAIPNYSGGSPTSWKYVHVQVTYFDDGGFGTRPPTVSLAGATLVSTTDVTNTVVTSGPPQNTVFGRWITRRTIWLFRPCPGSETVVVRADPAKDALIDQIIVDTRCPIPGDGDVPAFRPCWRGQPGSTFQQWVFGVSDNPAAPESVNNPYGTPQASMVVGPFSDGFILEDSFLGCRQGIWNLAGGDRMTLTIPNNPTAPSQACKYIRVQVTQYRDSSVYTLNAGVAISGATLVSQQQTTIETTLFGAQWVVHQSIWRLASCPSSESVVLTGPANGSLIDQVVVDTLCLDPACPSNLGPLTANPGECSKLVSLPTAVVDGCKITGVVCRTNGVVIANPNTFPVGTTPVACTVTDGEGGTKTCNFSVAVSDNQPPTITCPSNISVARNPSLCGAIVTFAATPHDNCPGATATCTPASGSLFPLGSTTVSCTAHDASGTPSAACTFQVRVVDFTGDLFAPCWRSGAGSTFQHWAFSTSANPVAPELSSNPYGAPQGTIVVGPFSDGYIPQDAFLGCRQGIWNLGSLDTMTLNIPNTPSAPPTAFKYVRVQVTQYRDQSIYFQNADVSISGATLVSQQQQTIDMPAPFSKWVVHQTIWRLPTCPSSESVVLTGPANGSLIDEVVVDTYCQQISCPANIAGVADANQCSMAGVSWTLPAVDMCTIRSVVCRTNGVIVMNPGTFPVGTTIVSCDISDAEAQTYNCTFTVTINDTQPPVITCPLDITLQCPASTDPMINPSVGFATATDNCSATVTYTDVVVAGTCPGTRTVNRTWKATDPAGSVTTCKQTIIVADTEAPVIIASGSTLALGCNPTAAQIEAALGTATATDNCGPVTPAASDSVITVNGCQRSQTRTWMVSDPCGNTATAVGRTVTWMEDIEAPVLTGCPLLNGGTYQCLSIVPPPSTVTAIDNCQGTIVVLFSEVQSAPGGSANNTITRTWSATDACGNNATCVQTILVNDTTLPVMTCPVDMVVDCTSQAGTVVNFTATATDNCGAVTPSCTPASGSLFAVGMTTVNCTGTDPQGNMGTCSFMVTVQAKADLSVEVAASPNPVTVGNELTYTMTVRNNGPCDATGVMLSHLLSSGQSLLMVRNGAAAPFMACPVPGASAWWRAGGNANDSAGLNHGTLNGGVTFTAGEVGQAFKFDGLSGYVSVPDAPALRPSSFTIEGWIKIQDPNGVHVIVSKPQGANSADSYSIWIASGVLYAAISDGSGSGTFLTYPELPSSSLFVISDIVNLPALANKLKAPAPGDPVSQYVNSQLSPATLALLAAYVGGPDASLQRHLVADFNRIIQAGALYTPARFAGVTLSAEATYVLGRNPTGVDLVRLNRLLIRDAYPADIVMDLFPQLNQRYHVAYTFDQATHTQALYINGVLVDLGVVNKTIAYDSHPLFIGADNDSGSPGFFYQGEIDELALFSRALAGTEIEPIHRVDGGGKCVAPGPFAIGSLASGSTHEVTFIVSPTSCGTVSASGAVSSTSVDVNAANNTASASSLVQDLPDSQLVMTIQKISPNNNLIRICWPVICGTYELQATESLNPPIIWTPIIVPVQVIGNRTCTVVLPSDQMRYFQLRRP